MDSQPIASNTTSNGTSNPSEPRVHKARFTRAERRAFTKEKKAGPQGKHGKKPKHAHKRDIQFVIPKDANTVDDVIAYLLTLRGNDGNRKVQDLSRVTKTIEGRVTRDAPKKKELSAKKLEKLQKRKEIRAEKRKARMEQMAQQSTEAGAEAGAEAQVSVAEVTEAEVVVEAPQIQQAEAAADEEYNFDEINFDDL